MEPWTRASSSCSLALQPISLVFEDEHRVELVGPDVVQTDVETEIQRRPEVERAEDEQSGFARLRRIEIVERAMVAAAAVLRRIGTQPRIAQLFAPEGPVDQEPEGGPLRPLPVQKFGSRSSWKPASSASIAAFTATA
ncbi:MAG: hypothetical protein LC130_32245 [Bryobacterales bacterium]|nr:hypothetical protein [Bryobacterales bacterium]MEB2364209.1 hypothetical protein [Bryobacterales bacterium]